jgi:hypothetical protein
MRLPCGIRIGTYGPTEVLGLSGLLLDLEQEIRAWGVFWRNTGLFIVVRRARRGGGGR